ncbi:MAG TPA: ATPase, T2SS/T4P/T4SS family, partial [Paraburkholderia sp.]|nr:ATPase, T2SS/T4P/T4SS family [Paraburkholderia sp.]
MDAPQPTPPTSGPAAVAAQPDAAKRVPTPNLIATILGAHPKTSDLIFSPGRPPQAKANGQLMPFKIQGVGILTPDDTSQIAADLIGKNALARQNLKEEGSCDISYSLPKLARFRVNVFTQRGTCAIVMRVIPSSVPRFDELSLPAQLADVCDLRNGIVLVTGPTGSGKSSTLAAIVNKINEDKAYHIITIEDPIEFL